MLAASDGSALRHSELPVRVNVVATDAEVDSIIQAARMKSESESGLSLHSL